MPIALLLATVSPAATVHSVPFGKLPDGRVVTRHILTNERGMTVELTDRGAAITRIALPERSGGVRDVVVGPADLAGLTAASRRYGAIVGRYAGRLRGAVDIDGRRYPLAVNASGVTLHGGDPGFDRALWSARPTEDRDGVGVVFRYVSRDGEQGFPGTLTVEARYRLARRTNTLSLEIRATSDRSTVANLTNHVYFDLSGGAGLGCQTLTVDAARRVALDDRKLPTGALPHVRETAFDFRTPRALRQVTAAGGIDDMLVLSGRRSARLREEGSGTVLTVTTDQPGLQVYTGNAFDGRDFDRRGRRIERFAGIALEPGNFPDAPAHVAFPNARVTPDRPYRWHATWSFSRERPRPCP